MPRRMRRLGTTSLSSIGHAKQTAQSSRLRQNFSPNSQGLFRSDTKSAADQLVSILLAFLWGISILRGNRLVIKLKPMSVPIVAKPEADCLGGFEHAKRSRGRDGSSHGATSTAEYDALAEEVAKLRVQNAELKSLLPPQMATSSEGVVGTVRRILAPGGTKPVKVWTSTGADGRGAPSYKSMPAFNVSTVGSVMLVAFFTHLPGQLLQAGVPEDRPAAAAACAFVRAKLANGAAAAVTASAMASIEAMGAAATTYGDPSPLHSLLTPTSAMVFVTTWRPFMDGMATTAEAIDIDSPNAVGLTLRCLATYLKPDRLSLTGAVIGASILEYTRGHAVNAMAFDLQAFYSVEFGSTCGTGDVQPDQILNSENLVACADFFFTLIFFNSLRKVLSIDGDVNKVSLAFMPAPHSCLSLSLSHRFTVLFRLPQIAFFAWLERVRVRKGIMILGIALAEPVLSYIAGISGAEFSDTSGLSILLLFIPASDEGDGLAHLKLIIFGWSACYGCARGESFGPKLKHATMQFVAGLAMLPKRPFNTESPLYGIKQVGMAAMLTEWLGVIYLTPSSAGGAAVAATWELIRAHEAANQPLPADLALWKERSAIWERTSSSQAKENMANILSAQPHLLRLVALGQQSLSVSQIQPQIQPQSLSQIQPQIQQQSLSQIQLQIPPRSSFRCMWCATIFTTSSMARRHGGAFHPERFEGSKRYSPAYYCIKSD